MINQNTPENYDKLYIEQPDRWSHVDYFDFYIEYFLKKIYDDRPLKLLDMGCGLGRTIKWIKRLKNIDITGIDFSQEALNLARRKNPEPEIKLLKMDMKHTPFKNQEFDVVLSVGTHEHLPEIDFSEPRRLIKDDHFFICILPDIDKDCGWTGEGVNQQWLITKEMWVKELTRFNFRVIKYIKPWIFICYPYAENTREKEMPWLYTPEGNYLGIEAFKK